MNDKFFYRKYDELCNYASDKISSPYEGDITDIYVVIEQEMHEDSRQKKYCQTRQYQ